ncbi:MAG: metallophosphoesterase [Myxococcota bacterium]
MRIIATWEIEPRAPEVCAICGTKLIPYVPKCPGCAHPVPTIMREIARAPSVTKAHGVVRVAHLSDLHIGYNVGTGLTRPNVIFRQWLERLVMADTDVLVLSGDIVERPGDGYGMKLARALIEEFALPTVVVPGNHDLKRPGHHDVFFDVFGTYPRVEVQCGVEFLLVDSMNGLPIEERDVAERMYGDYVCYTEGKVGEAQLAALGRELDRVSDGTRRPRLMVLHHHVTRQSADILPHTPETIGVTEDFLGTMKALIDGPRVLAWCVEHGVQTLCHGHKHVFMQPGMRPGRLLVLNGGSSTLRRARQLGRLIDYRPGGARWVHNVELAL